jgi:hypothetical protein
LTTQLYWLKKKSGLDPDSRWAPRLSLVWRRWLIPAPAKSTRRYFAR